MYKYILTIITCIAITSCQKNKVKKTSSIYTCTVNTSIKHPNGFSKDSTFHEDVAVFYNAIELIIFDHVIHKDSLISNDFFDWVNDGDHNRSYQIKFTEDSLYFISKYIGNVVSTEREYAGLKVF